MPIQGVHAAATTQTVTLPPIPELFDPNFLDVLILAHDVPIVDDVEEVGPNTMMDALRSAAHQKFTSNYAPTFGSTLVATLDAYLGLRTGILREKIDRYLENAWAEDPNLTLRIIWSTRSIYDGKGERDLFHRAFGWLFEKHPRTAITNLHYLVDLVCHSPRKGEMEKTKATGAPHGCWKDLLDILALATVDELRPKLPLDPRCNFLHNHFDDKSRPRFKSNEEQEEWSRDQRIKRSRRAYERLTQKLLDKHYRALYIAVARLFADQLAKDANVMDKIDALSSNVDKEGRLALMHDLTLVSKWAPTPGGSHDRVTNISSAICLLLHEAHVPSLIAHSTSFSVAASLPALDMHVLRSLYQTHILTRGRRYTWVPEPLMSSNRWSKIAYSRVASICMNKSKEKFFIKDEKRFLKYLEVVDSGKRHISGATLLPHLLAIQAAQVYRLKGPLQVGARRSLGKGLLGRERQLAETQMNVVDAQWATLVARLRTSGQLDNCIAVCDVSRSMGFIWDIQKGKSPFEVSPIWPALSLSFLVARLAKPPFNDSFITFSESPQFVTIDPESWRFSLCATIDCMTQANFGNEPNFDAIFLKLILPLAIKHKVPKDQMIKRVFVFTSMQFNKTIAKKGTDEDSDGDSFVSDAESSASSLDAAADWKTNHDVIAKAFAKAGYAVPELVYWNLSNIGDGQDITAPVTGDRQGVALLSGYSPSLLKVFMDEGHEEVEEEVEEEEVLEIEEEEGSEFEVYDKSKPQARRLSLTPEKLMKKVLGKTSYGGLVVVD